MYYACLRVKKEAKSQTKEEIIKKEFNTREEARSYIASIRDDETKSNLYDQFWTE